MIKFISFMNEKINVTNKRKIIDQHKPFYEMYDLTEMAGNSDQPMALQSWNTLSTKKPALSNDPD